MPYIIRMRYFLWHVSTFVPIVAKILIAPWGLKVPWLMYLFFTYILLEHRNFNGYPVATFANLQRQAECCMILGLFLSYWISPLLASMPFLLITKAKGIQIDELSFSGMFFLLIRFDLVQILLVVLSIMTILLDTEEVQDNPESWNRGCQRRIMFRAIQVMCITCAYEELYTRIVLLGAFAMLKVAVYLYAPPDHPDRVVNVAGDPVRLLQGKAHRL
jgi:hypothetical protein